MTVTLVTFGKKGEQKTFDLTKPTTVIGRKTDADLRIPLSDISRSHCEFTLQNGSVLLRDLDSSNGTYVNGSQINEVKLSAGDEIRVGPVMFTVQIDGKPAEIQPPQARTAATKADSQAPTVAGASPGSDEFDVDDLEELDVDDMSDLDLDEDFNLSDDDLDLSDDLEEIDEKDIIE